MTDKQLILFTRQKLLNCHSYGASIVENAVPQCLEARFLRRILSLISDSAEHVAKCTVCTSWWLKIYYESNFVRRSWMCEICRDIWWAWRQKLLQGGWKKPNQDKVLTKQNKIKLQTSWAFFFSSSLFLGHFKGRTPLRKVQCIQPVPCHPR